MAIKTQTVNMNPVFSNFIKHEVLFLSSFLKRLPEHQVKQLCKASTASQFEMSSELKKEQLPTLPVQPLDKVMEKYLRSVKPFLNSSQFQASKELVEKFCKDENSGKKLQKLLQDRAQNMENWLSDWWLSTAYLEYRDPVIVYSSPGLVWPRNFFSNQQEQLHFASHVIYSALMFNQKIEEGLLPHELLGKDLLCMTQYNKIFGTCRIPKIPKDELLFNNQSTNIIVMYKNNFFSVPVFEEASRKPLSKNHFYSMLCDITSSESNLGPAIGILTTEQRDNWAKCYSQLKQIPENKKILEDHIEKSLFVVCIDEPLRVGAGHTYDTRCSNLLLHGYGTKGNVGNRWYDKTIQFIIGAYDDGTGIAYEHSPAEGGPIGVLTNHILESWNPDEQISLKTSLPIYQKLEFVLSKPVTDAIKAAGEAVDRICQDLEVCTWLFKEFGKSYLKELGVSPDSFIQVGIQYAFYKIHKHPAAQYESGSLRKFMYGRTDVIRTCCEEVLEFCKVMTDPVYTKEQKERALQVALNAHKNYVVDVIKGKGVDRHLLGLKILAKLNNMNIPEIFTDEAFCRSTHFQLSTSNVNISTSWFLPQEGFPVFYRYYNVKMTWNEAEAVCGFHHADLLSVQTGPQMDAARAYLKEIDVTDNVWIGLQKQSPELPFSWTNGEKLLGDGYWLEPFPKTNEKLCAAIDPISDFRWNSFYCRGPQVASFVCELPVPDWAKKENGCMLTNQPSLSITYIPEVGIIQLFSDCGLDGTRRIACKGGVNREELIQRLSCDEDIFDSTVFTKSTTDAVKRIDTQQSTRQNWNQQINRDETTQTVKTLETNSPQTRHKRDIKLSTEGILMNVTLKKPNSFNTTANSESSTQISFTQNRGNVLNTPMIVLPLLLKKLSEKNISITNASSFKNVEMVTTKLNKSGTLPETTSPIFDKLTTVNPILELSTLQKLSIKEMTTKSPKEPFQGLLKIKEINSTKSDIPPIPIVRGEVPLLIITGETFNDTSSSGTSENPQIVFMIDQKEGFAEPYLVPLNGDVIVNNSSLSPFEVIDVDLVGFENLTTAGNTKTLSTNDVIESNTASPLKLPSLSHKLRENNEINPSVTQVPGSADYSKMFLGNNYNIKPSKTVLSITEPDILKEHSQTAIEEIKNEALQVPQRPNRGRVLTHSNHPSFYPYFLNRVLG